MRLDEALVARGHAESRSRAKRLILAGQVRVNGHVADKPGTAVPKDAEIELLATDRFVSRGGEKLAPALSASGILVAGRVALEVGASTGGFTDCLLQAGAAAVIAVDVGYGQLAWSLRQDPRVHVLERTNARTLSASDLPSDVARPSILVMDVSFIGIGKVLPTVTDVCSPVAEALLLVKPQFEAGPDQVQKGGVVRSADVRRAAIDGVAGVARSLGWTPLGGHPSPLRGPAGNWECLLQLSRGTGDEEPDGWLTDIDVPNDEGAR